MAYSIPYKRNSSFKYYNEVSEWKITFRMEDKTLPEFLSLHEDKIITIILPFWENKYLPFFSALREKHKNFKLELSYHLEVKDLWKDLKDHDIPFFFVNPVYDWGSLYEFIEMGVTDIYPHGQMLFELEKLHDICSANIRVIANLAQGGYGNLIPPIKQFFIRPDDLETYLSYVDVIEFVADSFEQYNVYYEIYEKDKKWFGKLNEIIKCLKTDIDNRTILSTFAGMRINCSWRCMKGKQCRVCEATEAFAKTAIEKGYILK